MPDAATRAARIENPRSVLDMLGEAKRITAREFEAGLYLQALERKLYRGRDARAEAVLQLLRDELNKMGRGTWAMVREVCIEHLPLVGASDERRLRESLQAIAMRVDTVLAAIEGAEGTA